MPTDPDGPADTTIMRIVHQALRRDLERARQVLAEEAGPSAEQRRAIGSHLSWVLSFLRAHHESEDRGLYATARGRAQGRPELLEVLDRMEHQHHLVEPAITSLERAAAALDADPSAATSATAVAALDDLAEALLPHLRQEEDEAMPVVASLVSQREWQDLEQRHNLDGKSSAQLGVEGHWLIDGATEADRAVVLGLVPPVPRFLLVHGYGRSYRRRSAACWGGPAAGRPRVQKRGSVAVRTEAGIDAVWAVVRDVTRVGEWSGECVGARWLGGASAATPGARFRGRNRAGVFRWGRVCEVVAAAPYELVWRTVPTALFPDSTEWRIALAPAPGGGATIEQSFEVVKAPELLDGIYARLIPSHRDRAAELTEDLRRLGAVAAAIGAPGDPTPASPAAATR
jgi:hemerythrin-like domain-containing protein